MQQLKEIVISCLMWLIIFPAVLLAFSAHANLDVSPASFQQGKLSLAHHLTVWVPGRNIPEAEIVAGQHDAYFVQPEQQYLAQEADNWIRFSIENTGQIEGEWVLDLQTSMISDAVLLVRDTEGIVVRQQTGLKFGYEDRPVPYNHFVFPVHQKAQSVQTYYLKISTPFQLYFAPTLADYPSFLKIASLNYSFGHLFIGLLIGVFVYLLVLYLSPVSRPLVSGFIWFVLFAMLVMLYVNGFLMAYLPTNEWLSTRLWVILHVCLQTSYLLVTQQFFQTREHYPKIHQYLSACIVSAAAFFALVFFVSYTALVKAELFFAAQLIIGITFISCYIWWKERRRVALFTIGNIGLMITAALSTFAALSSVAASDWIVQHGFEVGFCWQAILFTWALTRRINSLATSAAVADAESKAKSEFIAKMSHEIRTPMNGVIGMVQMLQSTPINTEQKHYLNVIDSSGKILLAVINDILDYSKLMAGKIDLHPQMFNLEDLLAELKTLFADEARNKNLSFSIMTAPEVPLSLWGDSIRLRQILMNLLSNAFKFTEHGQVRLEVSIQDDQKLTGKKDPGQVILHFVIRDTGIGISPEDQKQLFKSFSRVHVKSGHRYGGSGLGLSICKQFVEMMGGEISVSSRQGHGAEFSFFIKLIRAEQSAFPDSPKKIMVPLYKRILVVEDNGVNCEVISAVLKKYGCFVQTASHGGAAIDILQQSHDDFDMVLMDCEMPIMDGISASKQIRQYENQFDKKAIPIIALTAHASAAHRKLCENAGMNGYLIKPVSFSQIEEILSRKYP